MIPPIDPTGDLRVVLNFAVLITLIVLSMVLVLLVVSQFYTVKILRRIDERDYGETLRLAKELEDRIERDERREQEAKQRHDDIVETNLKTRELATKTLARLESKAADTNVVAHETLDKVDAAHTKLDAALSDADPGDCR
jgi:biopolymer transport protein ExbB/TolQ